MLLNELKDKSTKIVIVAFGLLYLTAMTAARLKFWKAGGRREGPH
jgi:hypothetical protein